MSRELRIVVVALVGVVAIYFAVGSILPNSWQVQTVVRMPCQPDRVLPLVSDFGQWLRWTTVASTARTDTKIVAEGTPGTVGHQLAWRSSTNEAVLRLARVDAAGIDYDFLMRIGTDAPLQRQAGGSLRLVADADGTAITWTDRCEVRDFMSRWVAWFGAQQEAARGFQEASLARLRVELEAK